MHPDYCVQLSVSSSVPAAARCRYPLHSAIWDNNVTALRSMITLLRVRGVKPQDPGGIDEPDLRGYTPLHLCVLLPDREECLFALFSQSSPETRVKCPDGWSPLSEAICQDNVNALSRILEHRFKKIGGRSMPISPAIRNLISQMSDIPDFTVEIDWLLKTHVPLLGRLTPRDTLRLTKIGSALRIDMTAIGLNVSASNIISGDSVERGNVSLFILGNCDDSVLDSDNPIVIAHCDTSICLRSQFSNSIVFVDHDKQIITRLPDFEDLERDRLRNNNIFSTNLRRLRGKKRTCTRVLLNQWTCVERPPRVGMASRIGGWFRGFRGAGGRVVVGPASDAEPHYVLQNGFPCRVYDISGILFERTVRRLDVPLDRGSAGRKDATASAVTGAVSPTAAVTAAVTAAATSAHQSDGIDPSGDIEDDDSAPGDMSQDDADLGFDDSDSDDENFVEAVEGPAGGLAAMPLADGQAASPGYYFDPALPPLRPENLTGKRRVQQVRSFSLNLSISSSTEFPLQIEHLVPVIRALRSSFTVFHHVAAVFGVTDSPPGPESHLPAVGGAAPASARLPPGFPVRIEVPFFKIAQLVVDFGRATVFDAAGLSSSMGGSPAGSLPDTGAGPAQATPPGLEGASLPTTSQLDSVFEPNGPMAEVAGAAGACASPEGHSASGAVSPPAGSQAEQYVQCQGLFYLPDSYVEVEHQSLPHQSS
ncbi:hypothetical protein H696_03165 [Fonticula alba]|uniref:Ankyrin repeat domain-containing protein n=1 Tax=Fonticula alba TaxID=691883 RepID=A0A058Z921_FONAL|nr:hypothetical protein H696_03165 [Fonticula alba]KCV70814.1 hypothetical protein H696_03165 [Fonticula alba]|eukprot:XP_009495330.1 hypothetical protein H696_03165 [Fonticula alba]